MTSKNTEPHTSPSEEVSLEHAVFRGLTPRVAVFETPCDAPSGSVKKTLASGLPLLMTGTLATGVIVSPGSLGHTEHLDNDEASGSARLDQRPGIAQRLHTALLPVAHSVLSVTRPDLPATYTVQAGDSPSAIADRFGIPTPAILTLNGLSWNTVLHEGQVLKLTAEPTKKRASSPARVASAGYVVQYGDSVSRIADRLGISTQALLSLNNLGSNAAIYPGQYLKVPGATKPTVTRDAPAEIPRVAQAPTILSASLSSGSDAGQAVEESNTSPNVFDAADLPLAEKPTLITVRVAPKAAAPAPAAPARPAAVAPPSGSVGQPTTGTITPLNDERRANARIIISVGRELGVPDYGIVIALATAMQESSLRNINWGDRDSLGLYQQRPSSGWGTAEQIMDPVYSTRLFFGGPSNPNRGRTRGLLDIAGWQNMALTDAAQRVQISAFPQAYAKWEPSAWAWLYELT
jgi:LysM repeat protein